VPPGARLAGRTLVGVRCADGSPWQAFLSADVRIDAPVWQSTRALRAGETLGAADVVPASMPLTPADIDAALADARGAPGRGNAARGLASIDGRQPAPIGRVLLRPVAAGRALLASDVRDEGRINAGEPVKVVYQGDGFSVSAEGRAVGPADPGSAIQIRLASGNLVSGTLRADHLVELPR
jgi:flagella basal body P-ring formation protein FlgA